MFSIKPEIKARNNFNDGPADSTNRTCANIIAHEENRYCCYEEKESNSRRCYRGGEAALSLLENIFIISSAYRQQLRANFLYVFRVSLR